jgi:predicted RND superfamily exporter protein
MTNDGNKKSNGATLLALAMVAVAVLLGAAVWKFVDLAPHVDEAFFFGSDDPSVKEGAAIGEKFPTHSQLYISVAAPDITTGAYYERVRNFSDDLQQAPHVAGKGVRSVTHGPKDMKDALESPLWSRLFGIGKGNSTMIIVSHDNDDRKRLIAAMEAVAAKHHREDFQVRLAGVAYVVELIRRNLVHDLLWFTVTTFLVFGAAVGVLFRSVKLLAGTLATCFSAMTLTLIAQQYLLGMHMGILTTNLSTMVFVITLSHIIFLTSNWRTIAAEGVSGGGELMWAAWRRTIVPSFWCMATTVMGFCSLLMVSAHPLKELGRGGALGTVIAMVCAYVMYPVFLRWATPRVWEKIAENNGEGFWARSFAVPVVLIVAACAALAFGLPRLNTDPSLIEYFGRRDPIRTGLEYVDVRGGSSPLELVVRRADGGKLTTADSYERLWNFQNALEKDRNTGVVLSLPVLMAEAKRQLKVPDMAQALIPWDFVLTLAEQTEYKSVVDSFVTKDRTEGKFMMRMVEQGRDARHTQVVERLRELAREHGLEVKMVGGAYFLQGKLAEQVSQSLLKGLLWLVGLFVLIALAVTLSLRGGLAMIFALCLVPLSILGALGVFGIAVDIISAPATNVCIGMAVDSMIHLARAVRRKRREGAMGWEAWTMARVEQWRGVVGSCAIVAVGFAIFALSDFPPTQRFGAAVVFGTIIAALAALFVFPLVGGWKEKR